jgi:hypothetical protein
MFVPVQAKPIQRADRSQVMQEAKDVMPQITCTCKMSKTAGVNTWHCLMGRDIWDTLQACTPTS